MISDTNYLKPIQFDSQNSSKKNPIDSSPASLCSEHEGINPTIHKGKESSLQDSQKTKKHLSKFNLENSGRHYKITKENKEKGMDSCKSNYGKKVNFVYK